MNVILTNKNVQKTLRDYFETKLGLFTPSQFNQINNMIDDIIKNVNTLKVKYNNIEYYCLDIYKIINMKRSNPDSARMCKIELENLYEINNIIGQENRNTKVAGETYLNEPKIWGSCFYNVPNDKTSVSDQNNIKSVIKDKYNISPTCTTDNIVENIKCKEGCPLTNNKFVGFGTDNFVLNVSKTDMVSRMSISSYSFLKIKIQKLKQSDGIKYKYTFSFVKFNNTTKEFSVIPEAESSILNTKIRNNLYTLEKSNNDFIFRPNKMLKNVYICTFYDNKLTSYITRGVDNFSLSDFGIPNVTLTYTNEVFGAIVFLMITLQRNCDTKERMSEALYCFNQSIEFINNIVKLYILAALSSLRDRKATIQATIRGYNDDILKAETDKNNCSVYSEKSVCDDLAVDIRRLEDRLNSETLNEGDRRYISTSISDKTMLMSTTFKCKTQSDIDKCISDYDKDIDLLRDKINDEANTIPSIEEEIQRNTEIKLSFERQERPYFIKPIETYFVNNKNVYLDDLQKTNIDLPEDSVVKYIKTLYNDQFLLSNDDCIYVKID